MRRAGPYDVTVTSPTLSPTRTWSAVLFDLDGTIVDSATDIMASLAHTFTEMGLPVPADDVLRSYVGPPLLDSLRMTAGFTDAEAWEALNVYRDHYGEHLLASPVFPGVAGVLERLHAAGVPIALATSKPESMARAVLEHNDLTAVLHRDRRSQRRRGAQHEGRRRRATRCAACRRPASTPATR